MTAFAQDFPLLSCKGLGVDIDTSKIVGDFCFEANAGEFIALCGPNGAGKSTLVRALANLIRYSGDVFIANRPASTLSRIERAKRISYLPQNGSIHWPMPVRDLVALGRLPFGHAYEKPGTQDEQAINAAMKACDIRHLESRAANTLSGGERARVLLARAIATQADVLLADEPLAALDPAYQLTAMQILKDYAASGHAVIAVTHDISLTMSYAHRFLAMKGGRLLAEGDGKSLFERGVFDECFGVRFEALTGTNHEFAGIIAKESSQANGSK